MKKKKTRWISVTYNRTKFEKVFNLFGLSFTFKINKRVPYSNKSERIKPLNKALKSGEYGELYGVRFISSSDIK